MTIRKAFQFRLLPNGAAHRKLCQCCGCRRFVYNKQLELAQKAYEECKALQEKSPDTKTQKPALSAIAFNDLLPALKKEFPFLKQCYSQVFQQADGDLSKSSKAFQRDGRSSEVPEEIPERFLPFPATLQNWRTPSLLIMACTVHFIGVQSVHSLIYSHF